MSSKFAEWCARHARTPRRVGAAGMVAAATVLTAVAATSAAVAASDTAAAPKPIKACYKPGRSPATLGVPTAGKTSCPRGDKTLTWNKVGPQGPAGASAGVSGNSATSVTVTSSAWAAVVQAAPVKTTGVYYINASALFNLEANNYVFCELGTTAGVLSGIPVEVGAFPTVTVQTLSLTGALTLAAGDVPTVECGKNTPGTTTYSYDGSITAILISQANPAQPKARHSRHRLPALAPRR